VALAEGGKPMMINTDLESLGSSNLKSVKDGMAAHPKKDAQTGELITFRSDWNQPWLTYGVIDPKGYELNSTRIDINAPMMMHDMAITATHSVLFDLGVAYDFSMMEQGFNVPIRWHEERRCRIGVIPRFGVQIRWFEIESCFIQHISNAYNESKETIIIDAVRYPWYMRVARTRLEFDPNPLGGVLYKINFKTGIVKESAIDDLGIEFPRINETLVGQIIGTCTQRNNLQTRKFGVSFGMTLQQAYLKNTKFLPEIRTGSQSLSRAINLQVRRMAGYLSMYIAESQIPAIC